MAAVETNHARRNSYEYEDLPVLNQGRTVEDTQTSNVLNVAGVRTRTISTPSPLSAGPHRTSFNLGLPSHGRTHSQSGGGLKGNYSNIPSSAGPYRTSFSTSPGINGNGSGPGHSPSPPTSGVPNGTLYGRPPNHGRAPSLTSDTASSPFRTSFSPISSPRINGTGVLPAVNESGSTSSINGPTSSPPPSHSSHGSNHARRHSRIHSRNLSIYFPRPGATAVPSIAEDGSQEVEAPVTLISSTPSSHSKSSASHTPLSGTFVSPPPSRSRSQLDGGFKFGKKPPPGYTSQSSAIEDAETMDRDASLSSIGQGPGSVPMSKANTPTSSGTSSRKGHHHRHSLSHSFFSFMEPGSSPSVALKHHHRNDSVNISVNVTSPSPTSPSSPSSAVTNGWGPLSPFPLAASASATSAAFPPAQLIPPKRRASLGPGALPNPSTQRSSPLLQKILALPQQMRHGLMFSLVEGIIGCGLWVIAQHVESLACAGLAYWVVFDAIGVALGVYGRLVDSGTGGGSLRLPYGAKRTEALALFAQSVYLLFAAVYICKETLEHMLLSAGDAGHHHHHPPTAPVGDQPRSTYPSIFLWLSFISLSLSSVLLKSNIKILDATGSFIPSFRQLFRIFSRNNQPFVTHLRPSSSLLVSNPYTLFPLTCALLLISLSTLPISQEESLRTADIVIAGFEAIGTWYLAYPACLKLGTVLLQTAPQRAHSHLANGVSLRAENLTAKGTMEALLRAMKEIERHPQVLHLPAPHVWQIAPPSTILNSTSSYSSTRDDDNRGHQQANGYGNGHGHLRSKSTMNSRGRPNVIVAVEIHVKNSLDDVECLELTRWAWQRCTNALGQGEEGVTVGIVKG